MLMSPKIYDNFLDPQDFIKLKNYLVGPKFEWYYRDYIAYEGEKEVGMQFTHFIYIDDRPSSRHYDFLKPVLNKIKPGSLRRIKANLIPRTPVQRRHPFHQDYDYAFEGSKTAILHLNTCDGKTIFKGGKDIDTVENRMIIFPTETWHSGTSTTNTPYRMLINFCWY